MTYQTRYRCPMGKLKKVVTFLDVEDMELLRLVSLCEKASMADVLRRAMRDWARQRLPTIVPSTRAG